MLRPRFLLGAIIALPALAPGTAWAEPVFVFDASLEAGYSTNPFQAVGGDTGSGVISASVAPAIEDRDARGGFRLGGRIAVKEYLERYNTATDYGATFNVDRILDARTQLRGTLGFSSAITGDNDLLFPSQPGTAIEPVVPPAPGDITLNGVRRRQQVFSSAASVTHKPSARDVLALSVSGSINRFSGRQVLPVLGNGDEYNSFGQRLTYFRVLSADLSVGGAFGATRTDYRRTDLGDGRTLTPQLTAQWRPGPQWSVDLAIGASFTRQQTEHGLRTQSALAGTIDACYDTSRSKFCVEASRDALPSAFDGITNRTSFGIRYSYRLSERSNIGSAVSYDRSARRNTLLSPKVEAVAASLNFDRQISRQFSLFTVASYGDTYERTLPRKANVQVFAGVRYSFGNRR